jgi:hypothetical protein
MEPVVMYSGNLRGQQVKDLGGEERERVKRRGRERQIQTDTDREAE